MNGLSIVPDESERDGQIARDDTRSPPGYVHPDLQDLSFGDEQTSLPPPLQPSHRHDASDDAEWDEHRGSLSDFSDYESEEDHRPAAVGSSSGAHSRARAEPEDPFADPFAD